jgi:hypothetical protein
MPDELAVEEVVPPDRVGCSSCEGYNNADRARDPIQSRPGSPRVGDRMRGILGWRVAPVFLWAPLNGINVVVKEVDSSSVS